MKSSEADAPDASANAFIARWQGVQLSDATELAASQTFILAVVRATEGNCRQPVAAWH